MAGLKPFREVPKDLREWTRWMRAQQLSLWEIVDFTGDHTLIHANKDKIHRSLGPASTEVVVPKNIFELGQQIVIVQWGAGKLTLVEAAGVTLQSPTTLVFNERYGSITIIQVDTNIWMVAGRMAAS